MINLFVSSSLFHQLRPQTILSHNPHEPPFAFLNPIQSPNERIFYRYRMPPRSRQCSGNPVQPIAADPSSFQTIELEHHIIPLIKIHRGQDAILAGGRSPLNSVYRQILYAILPCQLRIPVRRSER